MSISGISGLTTQVTGHLAEMKKGQEELFTNPNVSEFTGTLQVDSVSISSQALIKSQNMVSRGSAEGGNLLDILGIAKEAAWYADPIMRQAKTMKDSTESNAAVLADIKSSIEEQADEAMASSDENVEVIEQATTMPTDSTSSTPADMAPEDAADKTIDTKPDSGTHTAKVRTSTPAPSSDSGSSAAPSLDVVV